MKNKKGFLLVILYILVHIKHRFCTNHPTRLSIADETEVHES